MDIAAFLAIGVSVASILSAYYKIMSIHRKEKAELEAELKAYTDKEISHLKEISVSEIKKLEEKIDSLRDDLKTHQAQIIELLRKKD